MDWNREWMQKISMHDYVEVGDRIYFFTLNFNGLYRMKLSEKKLELLGYAPGEADYQKHIYGAITECAGKLYIPPRNGKEITVYNLRERTFEKVPIKDDGHGLPYKFSDVISYGGKVFFIPGRYRYLVAMDAETGEQEYIRDWIEELDLSGNYGGLLAGRGAFVKGGHLYMAAMADNILVKLSLSTMKAESIRIGEERNGFADMCMDRDGESIWFVQKGTPVILKWTERSGKCIAYDTMPNGLTYGEVPFVNIVEGCCKVTAIGYHANMSVEVDKADGTVRQAKWDTAGTDGIFNTFHAKHYFAKKISKESFLVSNIDDNSFDIVEDGNVRERFYLTDRSSELALAYFRDGAIPENGDYSLRKFMDFVASRDGKD